MFKNTYQNGLLSIFYSCGSNPLSLWDTSVKNGHIRRLTDEDVNSLVLEIVSTNVENAYMVCPKGNKYLGIRLPFLVMIIKNLKRYFSFEITIRDDKNQRRRFRTSNYQSTTKIKPFCTSMPIGLSGGWNQIQFNLSDFTRRAYGTQYIETLKVEIHANARIRRIYFSDRLYTEDQLPQDYKLYLPLQKKGKGKEEKAPIPKEEKKSTETEATAEKPPSKAPSKASSKASVASATKPPSRKSSVMTSTAPGEEETGGEEAKAEEFAAEGVEEAAPTEEGAAAEELAAAEEVTATEEAPDEAAAEAEGEPTAEMPPEDAPAAEAEASPEETAPEEPTAEAEAEG